ncbi:MAG: hypothetical protein IKT98_05455 [Selenomonadaceae bacterium]|nr:hypothetical protein [Selenomonadaceae bacterium]
MLTKEDKILWAEWMLSTDIVQYSVSIFLNFDVMKKATAKILFTALTAKTY